MFICNDCLEKYYTTAPSFYKSKGPCESCGNSKICNEIHHSDLNAKPVPLSKEDQFIKEGKELINEFVFGKKESKLPYDKSHDLMIPVIEKIEKEDYGFKMCRKRVEIYIDSTKEVIFEIKMKSRTESLFHALVWFLKYYNDKHKRIG